MLKTKIGKSVAIAVPLALLATLLPVRSAFRANFATFFLRDSVSDG